MDPVRFDTLTRVLSQVRGRRGVVALLAALPLGGVLTRVATEEAAAERPGDRLHHRHQQRNRKRRHKRRNNNNQNNNGNNNGGGGNGGGGGGGGRKPSPPPSLGNPGPCTANGGTCQQNSDCCGGNCFNFVCAAQVNQCGGSTCPGGAAGCCSGTCCQSPVNQCNSQAQCCAPNCSGRQCGTDGCGGSGTCGTCASEASCNEITGQCSCTPQCDGKTCGPDGCGGTCGNCAGGAVCQNGTCQTCDVCPTCTYTNVQAAVADIGGPLSLQLCPGTYVETITIGRALSLIGTGQGTGDGDTILVGTGSSVVTINSNVGRVTLQGLRITDGTAGSGAGVLHHGTRLTMIDCTVTHNNGGTEGAGISTDIGTTLFMTGCTVTDNHATGVVAFGGGLVTGGNATLTNCTISGNTANASTAADGNGGGIFHIQGTFTLDNTSVTGNSSSGPGGGIYNQDTVVLQNGSTVTGNIPNNCAGDPIAGCSG